MQATRVPGIVHRARFWFALIAAVIALLNVTISAAAFRGCRTDPVIVLSNGLIVQADVSYETTAEHVSAVNYVVHLPARGVSVQAIIKDPLMGDKEHIQILYDQQPNRYKVDTEIVVTAAATGTQYEATTRLAFGKQLVQERVQTSTFTSISSGTFSHTLRG